MKKLLALSAALGLCLSTISVLASGHSSPDEHSFSCPAYPSHFVVGSQGGIEQDGSYWEIDPSAALPEGTSVTLDSNKGDLPIKYTGITMQNDDPPVSTALICKGGFTAQGSHYDLSTTTHALFTHCSQTDHLTFVCTKNSL